MGTIESLGDIGNYLLNATNVDVYSFPKEEIVKFIGEQKSLGS